MSRLARAVLSYTVLPWFPIAHGFPYQFWEPQISDHMVLYPLLLPCIVGLIYLAFRRERNLLALVGLMILGNIAFGHLIYFGRMRHFGMTFVAFLIALWIQRSRRTSISLPAFVLLGLTAICGVLAAVAQWNHPFSNAGAEARWIRDHHLDNLPLVGAKDWTVVSVAEMLQRPIYFLDCNCTRTFLLLSDDRDSFTWDQVPQRLERAVHVIGKPEVLLMLSVPLSAADTQALSAAHLTVIPLGSFVGGEVPQDGTFLYKVIRTAEAGTSVRPYLALPAPAHAGSVELAFLPGRRDIINSESGTFPPLFQSIHSGK